MPELVGGNQLLQDRMFANQEKQVNWSELKLKIKLGKRGLLVLSDAYFENRDEKNSYLRLIRILHKIVENCLADRTNNIALDPCRLQPI